MEPISILFLAAVLTKMVTTYQEDREYARKGMEPPRYKLYNRLLDMAEKRQGSGSGSRRRGGAPARPGARGYVRDLWNDSWDDLGEHRRRARQERKDNPRTTRAQQLRAVRDWARRSLNRRKDGRTVDEAPVDDMVDVAGVRPEDPAAIPDLDPWEFSEPVDDEPEPVVHDKPAPAPARASTRSTPQDAFDRMVEAITAARLLRREPGMTNCDMCGREQHIDDLTPMTNGDQVQLWCDDHAQPDTAARGQSDDLDQPAVDSTTAEGGTAAEGSTAGEQPRLATVIPMFPIMKEPVMANAEITGLPTAIAFARGMASAHQAASTAGGEQYVAALRSFEVGDATIATVATARELSAQAAAAWESAAGELAKQSTVTEAYQAVPDAGNKRFVTGE